MANASLAVRVSADIQAMRAEFAKAQSVIDTTTAALKTASNAFDGAKIVSAANAALLTVQNLGGVTKLTDTQQSALNVTLMKGLEQYTALGRDAPSAMVALAEATSRAKTTADQLHESVAGIGPEFLKSAAGMATGLLSLQGVESGFEHLKEFVSDCVVAFEKGEAAGVHMDAALRSVGQFTPQLGEEYRALAMDLEGVSVNSHTLVEESMALFTSIGAVGPENMKRAEQAAADLSAGLGVDLTQATETLSKAFTGHGTALQKLGVTYASSADAGTRFQNVVDAVNSRFGGRAAADLETTAGQVKQLGNLWEDLEEQLGHTIMTNPVVATALSGIKASLVVMDAQVVLSEAVWKDWGMAITEALRAIPGGGALADLLAGPKGGPVPSPGAGSVPSLHIDALAAFRAELQKERDALEALSPATRQAIIDADGLHASTKAISDGLSVEEGTIRLVLDAHRDAADVERKIQSQQSADLKQQLKDDVAQVASNLESAQQRVIALMQVKDATDAVTSAWQEMKDAFKNTPQLEAPAGGAGDFAWLAKHAAEDAAAVKSNFETALGGLPDVIISAIEGGGDAVKAVASSLGSAIGKDIGTAVGGPLGGAIGGAIGSLLGLVNSAFVTPEYQQVMADVGANWGISITEATAKAIEASEGVIADALKQGADPAMFRGLAESLNLDKLLSESGGLTTTNFELWIGKAQTLFGAIKYGGDVGALATKELTTLLGQFGAQAEKSGGLWDTQFLRLIDDAKKAGVGIAEITALQDTQRANAAAGIGSALDITKSAYDAQAADENTLADLKAQFATASVTDQARIQQQITATNADLETQRGIIAATQVTSQAAASGLALSISGMIDSEMASGKSFVDAVRDQAKSIAGLGAELQQTGFDGGEAFKFIQDELDLVNDKIAGPALQALEGMKAGMVGLGNAGDLTQDKFYGLESSIGLTFQKLVDLGKDPKVVMAGMQDDLQAAWEAEQKFGFKADDTTQALIDQAVKAGEVGPEHKSSTDQMIDAMKHVGEGIDALVKLFTKDLPGAIDTTKDAIAKIPTHIGINFDVDTTVSGKGGVGGNNTGPDDGAGLPGHATGTHGLYLDYGRGTHVMLHGKERVMTEAEGRSDARASNELLNEVKQLRRDQAMDRQQLPLAIARAVRDAVLLA